jgi:hypothetical protein
MAAFAGMTLTFLSDLPILTKNATGAFQETSIGTG